MKHRSVRLTLQRGIPTLDQAVAFANEVRALRVRDPEKVIIVRHPDGAIMNEGSAEADSDPPPSAAPSSPEREEDAAAAEPRADDPPPPTPAPVPARGAPHVGRLVPSERVRALAELYERHRQSAVEHERRAATRRRLERAFTLAEQTLTAGGDYPSEQIRRMQEATRAVRETCDRAMAARARSVELLERHIRWLLLWMGR